MNVREYLFRYFVIIKEQFCWEELDQWTNTEFTKLSDAIYEKCKVLISRNTLKNILNKVLSHHEGFQPRPTTCDTLAQFIGYETWILFVESIDNSSSDLGSTVVARRSLDARRVIFIVGGLVLIGVIVFSFLFQYQKQPLAAREVAGMVSVSDTIGINPYTVSVHYDFKKLKGLEVVFDFDSYSASRMYEMKYLESQTGIQNICYFWPGCYRTNLIYNKEVVKQTNIYINSKDWVAVVFNGNQPPLDRPENLSGLKARWPGYVNFNNKINDAFIGDGRMYVSKARAQQIEGLDVNYYTRFSHFTNYDVSGDDFSFESSFDIDQSGEENFCFEAEIKLVGTRSEHMVKMVQPGCRSFAQFQFSEVKLKGFKEIIEGFEHDLSVRQTFKMVVKNRQVQLFMGGVVFHSNKYERSIGEIVGVVFTFKGAGAVNFVKLYNEQGKVAFQDDFLR